MDICVKNYIVNYQATRGFDPRTSPGHILEYLKANLPPYYTSVLVTINTTYTLVDVHVEFWKKVHVTGPRYAHFNILYRDYGLKLIACNSSGHDVMNCMYNVWNPLNYSYYAIDDENGNHFIAKMKDTQPVHFVSAKEWLLMHPTPDSAELYYYTSDRHRRYNRHCKTNGKANSSRIKQMLLKQ